MHRDTQNILLDTHKIIKKNIFFLVHMKMDQENIMFFKNQDESYTMVDIYLNNRFFRYKDSYKYYDTDVDKILLFRKSNNEFIIRYKDVNKMAIVPLQLEIKNFFGELHTYTNNNRVMPIHSEDKELFRKCR